MVEDVEGIDPELQGLFSECREAFEQRHVSAPITGAIDNVLLAPEEGEHRSAIGDGRSILAGNATDDRADRASHGADEIARERVCERARVVPVSAVPRRCRAVGGATAGLKRIADLDS